MDPISQGLLGSTAAQAVLQKRMTLAIWLIGLLAGMAPDLDILIRSPDNPLLFIKYHRHFTHSLFFIPFGGTLVAGFCLLCFRKMRPHWKTVWLAATIGYATHGLLDTCTSYGTVLLWPLNSTRYAWDIFPIVHPAYTITLLIGTALAHISQRRLPALAALACSTLLLGVGVVQHHRALDWQQSLAQARGHTIVKGRVMANIASLNNWRSYYIHKNKIIYDNLYIPWFGQQQQQGHLELDHFTHKQLPEVIRGNSSLMQDYQVFSWFSDGFLVKMSSKPLVIADGRYLIRTQPPIMALWGIAFPNPQAKHIKWLRQIQTNLKASD